MREPVLSTQFAYVWSRTRTCPEREDPSQTQRAFLRPSSSLTAYVQTRWKIADSSSTCTGSPNMNCLSYWSSCRCSDSFQSDQSDCFISLPRVSFITFVTMFLTSPSVTILYVGVFAIAGRTGGREAFGVQRSLSWSIFSCEIWSRRIKGRPLLEMP